jgi:hypothetical protein
MVQGIASVVEADRAGYDMPTVIWIRDASLLENARSQQPIYPKTRRRSRAGGASGRHVGDAQAQRNPDGLWSALSAERMRSMPQLQWLHSSDSQRAGVLTARRRHDASHEAYTVGWGVGRRQGEAASNASAAAGTASKCGEAAECLSWYDLMERLLESFRDPYINPFTGKKDLMTGDLQSCAANGCDEYAIVSNSIEIYEATIGVWNRLGYRTNSTSKAWHFEVIAKAACSMQAHGSDGSGACTLATESYAFNARTWQLYGRSVDFNGTAFRSELAGVLRHVAPSDVIIVKGPTQVQEVRLCVPPLWLACLE